MCKIKKIEKLKISFKFLMDCVEIIIGKFYFKINHTLIAQLKVASKRIENSKGNIVKKIEKLKTI